MQLRYLYVGSADTERDLDAWLAIPGAVMRWQFRHFGADVAAVELGTAPIVLLADHRPTGTVLPIYAVDDLDSVLATLTAHGWSIEARSLGTPEGPVALLRDTSGNEVALLRVDRPGAMDGACRSSQPACGAPGRRKLRRLHDPDHGGVTQHLRAPMPGHLRQRRRPLRDRQRLDPHARRASR